jgi:hypothetical protein
MAIIKLEELTAYMGGITLTTPQQGITETVIIPGVQQELELYLNRPVEPVQVRESTLSDELGWVTLKVTPVYKILGARYSDGNAITISTYYPPALVEDPSTQRRVDYSGLGMAALPFRFQTAALGLPALFAPNLYIVVDYLAGYFGYTDEALKLAILRVCAREVERQFDDTVGLRSGSAEASGDSDNRRKGWMPEELEQLKRIRRRVIR